MRKVGQGVLGEEISKIPGNGFKNFYGMGS